jgi:hypothetical protein
MSEICKLLDLAWKRCEMDMFALVRIWIGVIIGLTFFVLFTLFNLAYNFQPWVNYVVEYPAGAFSIEGAIMLSSIVGFINTLSMLTFLFIVVALFEYALSFTTVCYYYDNCSWVVPNQIGATLDKISRHFKSINEDNAILLEKSRSELKAEISKIKDTL